MNKFNRIFFYCHYPLIESVPCNNATSVIVAGGERGKFEGIRKSDVVRDYLERIGEELESEEELIEKKGLIEKVIDRLLYQVILTTSLIITCGAFISTVFKCGAYLKNF